ncbi:hypothetical protein AVEN_51992-1 [Araneus ventricosus]|uniref:Uncharacterized protein n=1 Tax=Araneus ventricosus TaxID=182803 RepID=A0A4Y2CHL1_ARAVE|nr:hypothetical protein AVEN_51992-1 [Araneus ventricosus]
MHPPQIAFIATPPLPGIPWVPIANSEFTSTTTHCLQLAPDWLLLQLLFHHLRRLRPPAFIPASATDQITMTSLPLKIPSTSWTKVIADWRSPSGLHSRNLVSEEQRLRDLISGMQLGDRKPSRLLLEMRSKTENKISEELLKSLFLQRLPTHVQQIMAISNDKLDRLAEMADGIMAAATDSVAIRAVTTLEEANLLTTLMEISSHLEARSRSHSQESRRRFRPRSASREVGNPAHCWYHQRFKQRAQQCRPPCSFQSEN